MSTVHWVYRFVVTASFPHAAEEISELCELDEGNPNDSPVAYLALGRRKSPPMSTAMPGEVVALCTSSPEGLRLHAYAKVAGKPCRLDHTPSTVLAIYGDLKGGVFVPLCECELVPEQPLPSTVLDDERQAKFLRGQSCVKTLRKRSRRQKTETVPERSSTTPPSPLPSFLDDQKPRLTQAECSDPFVVVGLDPTAGNWRGEESMARGNKAMPSYALRWDGSSFVPHEQNALRWNATNQDFWDHVDAVGATTVCIDGPNAAHPDGPRWIAVECRWDPKRGHGTRAAERELTREGISLFWTTQNTVMHFDGASRWIARSFTLFAEASSKPSSVDVIETHPHGAFVFLWRDLFRQAVRLPKKSRPEGKRARWAMLQAFITGLQDIPPSSHDEIDAVCAALVAGFHKLQSTHSYGTEAEGGLIWMPDISILR